MAKARTKKETKKEAPAHSFTLPQKPVPEGGEIPDGWRKCGVNPKRGDMMEQIGEAPEPAQEE